MRRHQPWEQQPWVQSYEHAILELDTNQITQKIQVAEAAISARLVELKKCTDSQEPNALQNALRVLQLMEKHGDWLKGAA